LDRGSCESGGSLEADIARWKATGGGTDREGNPVTKPLALAQAELVDGICQRYSVLPSEVLKEDVGLIKLVQIAVLGEDNKHGKPSQHRR